MIHFINLLSTTVKPLRLFRQDALFLNPCNIASSFLISIHSSPPKDPPQRHFVAAALVEDRSHSRPGHWDSSRLAWRCSPELAVVQVVEEGAASLAERPHHTAGPGRAVS